jgi:hypothetical protein
MIKWFIFRIVVFFGVCYKMKLSLVFAGVDPFWFLFLVVFSFVCSEADAFCLGKTVDVVDKQTDLLLRHGKSLLTLTTWAVRHQEGGDPADDLLSDLVARRNKDEENVH